MVDAPTLVDTAITPISTDLGTLSNDFGQVRDTSFTMSMDSEFMGAGYVSVCADVPVFAP